MQQYRQFPVWAVAAAIMLQDRERTDWHWSYKGLTEWVIESGLTALCQKGCTPWQSLKSALLRTRIAGARVFDGHGDGEYTLSDREAISKVPEVATALKYLDEIEDEKARNRKATMEDELKQAYAEIDLLKNKLSEIHKIVAS